MPDTPPLNNDTYSLRGRIEKFEHQSAIVVTPDNQKILWPIKNLPDDCHVGQTITLKISTTTSDEAERTTLAKLILNQILKSEG